jgi:hypothetical protein
MFRVAERAPSEPTEETMLRASEPPIRAEPRVHYADALRALRAAEVPFLVGGGFALYVYLGRWRATKDLDLFVCPGDLRAALDALAAAGFRCELTDAAWLAKAFRGGVLVDLIFCSYNGLLPVDAGWIDNGQQARLLDVPVDLVAPEEMIVSKCFVAARDRFDGSDISWMIRTLGRTLDWDRIEARIERHWQVLLWQLIHYHYVFPSDRDQVPPALMERLLQRMGQDLNAPDERPRPCRGPMFDRIHYRSSEEPAAAEGGEGLVE